MSDSTPSNPEITQSSGLADRVRRGRPPKARPETHEPEREPQGRAERIPLGVPRLKLTAATRPGFVRRWVNDQADRILQAQKGGYAHVLDEKGEKLSRSGSKSESLRVYLMEIREEWYHQDQLAKTSDINAVEAQIKRGELHGKVGQDGVYVPSKGIRITRSA